MKMDSPEALAKPVEMTAAATATADPTTVFLQIGALTRLLHDTLEQLGVMPALQVATEGLPDARSRLQYVAGKTAAAAEKVLNSVEQAKTEQLRITAETRKLAAALAADPVKALASGAVLNFVGEVEASTARVDDHLTDIMMAQDFHDLTGQVMAKVVALAGDLEVSLVRLLVQVVPQDKLHKVDPNALNGPVVNPERRTDVVANQNEVDDLLASLGF